jgi:hypothetical protein
VLVADPGNVRIRKILPGGTITTVAGDGNVGFDGDGGPALAASMSAPTGVTATANGSILIADSENDRVRRVDPDGTMRTVAGSGLRGFRGDGGRAVRARLGRPLAVVAGRPGTFLIADSLNNRIRVVSHGAIETVAGGSVFGDYGGDGGSALRARLLVPSGTALTKRGELVIADTDNNVVRLVTRSRSRLLLAVLDRMRHARRHHAVTLTIRVSRRSRLTIGITSRRQAVGTSAMSMRRGLTRLTIPPHPPGSYIVTLTARDRTHSVATDRAIVTWSRR